MGEGERETVECSGSKCVREEGELSGRCSWLVREGEDQEPASGDLEKIGFGEEAVGKGETLSAESESSEEPGRQRGCWRVWAQDEAFEMEGLVAVPQAAHVTLRR